MREALGHSVVSVAVIRLSKAKSPTLHLSSECRHFVPSGKLNLRFPFALSLVPGTVTSWIAVDWLKDTKWVSKEARAREIFISMCTVSKLLCLLEDPSTREEVT